MLFPQINKLHLFISFLFNKKSLPILNEYNVIIKMSSHITIIKLFFLMLSISFYNPTIILRSITPTELLLEDTPTRDSRNPHIKKLDNDYIVVAWTDDTNKVIFQIFNPIGVRQGINESIPITTTITLRRFLEALPNNQFIIGYGNSGNIYAKLFNYDGTSSGTQLVVNNDMPGFYKALEIARLDIGGFVFVWSKDTQSLYYRVYSATSTDLTASTLILENTTQKTCPAVKATPAGFIICWREIKSPNDSILCRFFDSNGPIGVANIIIDSFPTHYTDDTCLSIERLLNGNYVIAYEIFNGSYFNTFFTVINSSGVILVTEMAVNVDNGYDNRVPEIAVMSNGGFAIIYEGEICSGSCIYNVYMRDYNSNNSPIHSSALYNTIAIGDHYDTTITGLKNGGYAMAWRGLNQYNFSSLYDISFSMWYGDYLTTCQDISMTVKTGVTVTVDFANHTTDDYLSGVNIKFPSLANSGSILSSGVAIVTNTAYLYSTITYQSGSNADSFTIAYTAIDYFNNIANCNISFLVCYSTCETCNQAGTATDNMCLTCKLGYYQLGTNCVQSCLSFANYYTDTSTNTCYPCNSPCNECLGATNCTNCISGYYLVENQSNNNCVNTCPADYYFSDTDSLYKQCDSLCASCLASPTYCNTCIPTAYFIKDQHQCVASCPDNYGPDAQKVCQTCKSLNQYNSSGKCVSQCPTNEYPDTFNTCGVCTKFLYRNICYDACPDGTLSDTVNKTCYLCTDRNQLLYNNTCVNDCPTGFYAASGKCQSCTNNLFLYNGLCVQECPTGMVPNTNSNACITEIKLLDTSDQQQQQQQQLADIMTDKPQCSPTSCENGATCSISFNKITCLCTDAYLGKECQYDKETFDYNKYIGIYYN
jgi:hypothetical protein